ncbi:hypothetical protein C5167_035333 [Papaver somniferum]|uniref:Uncharacterized protein n=1 Tax=Papaver somniferum TaxID=3469 RepID=A0A4Y7KIX6_PAPSO|nr:hypothetical protein C5167_035333 [Papaver somniferum]
MMESDVHDLHQQQDISVMVSPPRHEWFEYCSLHSIFLDLFFLYPRFPTLLFCILFNVTFLSIVVLW